MARRIDMSSATVHDRVGRMEDPGIIEGYHARVDPEAADLGISATVCLRVEQGRERDALKRLADIEGVQAVHLTTGRWDVLMRVYATSTEVLREAMFDTAARMDGFARSRTTVVLDTHYESEELPV